MDVTQMLRSNCPVVFIRMHNSHKDYIHQNSRCTRILFLLFYFTCWV